MKEDKVYLSHIFESIEIIEEFVKGYTKKDLMTYDYPVLFEGESVIMKIISCIKNY